MMKSILVDHLSHTYPPKRGQTEGRQALKDISFAVETGEFFGLLGPNGSGKSTTFQILATLLKPTSGQLTMLGADPVRDPEAVRRRLSVVFQNPSVDEKLTVLENLTHHGHLYGLSGVLLKDRIAQALERLRLSDRSSDLVETLSGGLRRRVELAKALLNQPEILLLDEPTTGLDPVARRELWETLTAMRRQSSLTILVTTHLMEEADSCDRVTILNEGVIVAMGDPEGLKSTVGGDVLHLETASPTDLAQSIQTKFSRSATVVDGQVRLEVHEGAALIPDLVRAFPALIRAVRLSKPSLEDVFVRKTGHEFTHE